MTTYTDIKKLSVTLGFSLLLLGLGQNNAHALTLPDVPLAVFSSVENNVLLTFDDSGSMRWGFSPDGVNAQSGARRGCSSTFNGMAYNPTIVYTPPSNRGSPDNLQATPVNLPDADLKATKVVRLGRRHSAEPVITQTSPRGDTMYWIGSAGAAKDDSDGTDFHAAKQGYVSLTPLHVDLTEHAQLPHWTARIAALESGRV